MQDVHVLTLGLYQSHCYLLQEGQDLIIVDPGARVDKIQNYIKDLGPVRVLAIILTHGHVDHMSAASDLQEIYLCPVYAHPLEYPVIYLKRRVPSAYKGPFRASLTPIEAGAWQLGPFSLDIYHLPGHSPGHLVIRWKDYLFTGDVLFKGTVGSTDTYGGSREALGRSLKFLLSLEDALLVYPGHGPETRLGDEKDRLQKRVQQYT